MFLVFYKCVYLNSVHSDMKELRLHKRYEAGINVKYVFHFNSVLLQK